MTVSDLEKGQTPPPPAFVPPPAEPEIIAYAEPEHQKVATAMPGTVLPPTGSMMTGVTPIPAPLAMHMQAKKGSKCCGCCCDFRRAVIIVNVINLVLGVIGLVVYVGGSLTSKTVPINDDAIRHVYIDAERQSAIIIGVGLFFTILGLMGGVKFSIALVAANILWLFVQFITNTILSVEAIKTIMKEYTGTATIRQPIGTYIVSGIVMLLFVYPHAGFISEIKSGIMSKETYPREEFSCCCVQQRRN